MSVRMASQAAMGEINLDIAEIPSYVRGYHVYKVNWTPFTGEVLQLKRDSDHRADKSAIAVMKNDTIVGHVPYNLASIYSQFLKQDFNKASVEITGERVNRGAGYGLGVPCKYRLYGPKPYTDKIRPTADSLRAKGLL